VSKLDVKTPVAFDTESRLETVVSSVTVAANNRFMVTVVGWVGLVGLGWVGLVGAFKNWCPEDRSRSIDRNLASFLNQQLVSWLEVILLLSLLVC